MEDKIGSEVVIASTQNSQLLCLEKETPPQAEIVARQTIFVSASTPQQATERSADAAQILKNVASSRMSLLPTAIGVEGTLDYRVQSYKKSDSSTAVSLWHDTPLYVVTGNNKHTGAYHFICEIPKCTRKKFEIATDEAGTPIKQDEKKGVLREFKRGDLAFNYGCLPRTWEDPDYVHPDTGVGGDNDPIDVCEIGLRQIPTGGVRAVKVLGVLAMIDDGETDWKVVAIDTGDPWAALLNDIDDVERVIPGCLNSIREWFRLYKVPDGKPENKFGLDERFMDKNYTEEVILETHNAWRKLVSSKQEPQTKLALGRRESMRLGGLNVHSTGLGSSVPEVPEMPSISEESPTPGKIGKRQRISILPKALGTTGTHEYRMKTFKKSDESKQISLWHDIPLIATSGPTPQLNFICEIPKWTRKKFEIATDETSNPIKQDEKKGVLREFKRGDLMFNYGCLPRTWEDPDYVHPDTGVGGDNDPIDVCEIGLRQIPTGGVRAVKVLGVLAMIDDGETDWKVVAISADDKWAPLLHNIDDVEEHLPGVCHSIREWFRLYKVPDGKPENKFGLDERFMDKEYAMTTIMETHEAWKQLIKRQKSTTKLELSRRVSMM